jgi:PEP-CTERM motif
MNRVCRIGLLACLGLCFSLGQAFANSTANLTFVNVGPGNTAGGAYAYPYNFSINGSTTLTPMMCDAYNNHIDFGESWTANVHGILQGGMFGTSGQALLDYKAAGLIFLSVLNGNVSGSLGNEAVWALFSGNIPGSNNAAVQILMGQYLGLAANAPDSAFKGLEVYTALGSRPGYGPQEFIGYTPSTAVPEPGTLVLMGSGMMVMAGAIRRKLSRG